MALLFSMIMLILKVGIGASFSWWWISGSFIIWILANIYTASQNDGWN